MWFSLPDDLITVAISFLFPITASELRQDLTFYIKWSRVPSMFLNCQLRETRYRYFVCNPMQMYVPFYPRRYLDMRPNEVWGPTLPALGALLCKEALRDAKTYKQCALRWIWDCISNLEIYYWDVLRIKLFKRISPVHFQYRPGCAYFVEEALRLIDSCTPSSDAE
jgi:hypothetical protein